MDIDQNENIYLEIKRICRRHRGSLYLLLCVLFLALLTAAGCSATQPKPDPIANVEEDLPPLLLESAELRPLIFGGVLSGDRYYLQDSAILAVANGFSLDLTFSDGVNQDQILDAISIKGATEVGFTVSCLDPSTPGGSQVVNVYAPVLDPGDYQLIIASGFSGYRSTALEEPITISMQLDSQTEGEFFLLDSSGLPRPISYEECRDGLALSDTAKTFIIRFNQEVNQVSIQDSLIAGLREQPVIVAFSWLTPQQLRVNLTQIQAGMTYRLILEHGVDNKGNGILGACVFRADKASNIGVIQLATNEMTMIYQFNEERYYGIRSREINNRTLLQAGSSLTWSFGLSGRQLFSLPQLRYDLALPQNYLEPIWLDYDHLLGYNLLDRSLYLVSVNEGTKEYIYTFPERLLECRLSPDGRLLAAACRSVSESRKVDLLLIDMDHRTLLHHVPAFAQPYVTAIGLSAVNLTWSGNDTFLYYDGDDILRAYIAADGKVTDKKNTIEKDSRIIDYLLDEDLLLVKQQTNAGAGALYLIADNRSWRLRDIPSDAQDFYCVMIDDETLIYQAEGEIYRYPIPEQMPELIGSGLLLGVSASKDKAYYMINAEDYSRSAP